MCQCLHIKGSTHTNAVDYQCYMYAEVWQYSWLLNTLCHTPLTPLLLVVSQSTIEPFPQDGWTAVLLAARYGHEDLVQELCETFGADFLHRKKVRAIDCKWQWMVEWIVNVHMHVMHDNCMTTWKVIRRSEFLCFPQQHNYVIWVCHDKPQPKTYWKWKMGMNSW